MASPCRHGGTGGGAACWLRRAHRVLVGAPSRLTKQVTEAETEAGLSSTSGHGVQGLALKLSARRLVQWCHGFLKNS